ncbi:MAG TPA: O-antigen ligase family protein [Gaiellaceae bacterium]|nr:O-antigen ligase family protein [Gaiellaceae bacterium]
MERVELAEAAAVVGAVGAPVVLLARSRFQALAGLALLVLAEVGLALALVPDQLELIVRSPLRLGGAVAALALVAALAAAFVRWPAALPVALLAVAPVRVPIALGDDEAFLLLPLYGVLGAGGVALAYRALRHRAWEPLPLLLAAPAAGLAGFATLSLRWSLDPREGTIDLLFFLLPFALLAVLIAQTILSGVVTRALTVVLLAEAAVIAGIGLWQEWTRTLFFADELQTVSAYTSYFRVTSIFKDSSIYGRFLVLAIVVLLVLLWLDRLRPAHGLPLLGLLLVGLYFSYSQSSFIALFAAVLLIGLLAGDRVSRRVLAATTAALVLVAAGAVFAVARDESAKRVTSGRIPLASLTLPVFLDHPGIGVGIGAQPRASRRLEDARPTKARNVSHTTPLTVAAELGAVGLALYLAFLAATVKATLLLMRRDRVIGLSLLATFTVLVVHSLFYSGFFEDPFTWMIVGLAAAALARMHAAAPASAATGAAGGAVSREASA